MVVITSSKILANSVIIVVSDPLDALCYCAWENSGFYYNWVMGMRGELDMDSYKSFIAEALNVSTQDIHALEFGGDGKDHSPDAKI